MKKLPKLLLLCVALCSSTDFFAQSTQTGPGVAGHSAGGGGVPARYVGWDASASSNAIPLSIEHRGTNNINFFTGATQRMTILGTASGATAGFVGIGNSGSALNPLWQLDVNDNANLNINYNVGAGAGYGYRINGNKILSNPGTKNIFVGNGAGTGWSSLSPINYTSCVFVGENAGAVNQGASNTFIGDDAGLNNTSGEWNTFIGSNAGESNTTLKKVAAN